MPSIAVIQPPNGLPLSRGHRTPKSSTYRDGDAVAVGCSGGVGPLLTCADTCAYPVSVSYEWDDAKRVENTKKHGVEFADAVGVFEDDEAITISDDKSGEEDRFITIGRDFLGRIVVVVYTWRGENIRVISARKATRRQREQYEG